MTPETRKRRIEAHARRVIKAGRKADRARVQAEALARLPRGECVVSRPYCFGERFVLPCLSISLERVHKLLDLLDHQRRYPMHEAGLFGAEFAFREPRYACDRPAANPRCSLSFGVAPRAVCNP